MGRKDNNVVLFDKIFPYAIDNEYNILVMYLDSNWSAEGYTCSTPSGQFYDDYFNTTSKIYKDFLCNQRILLFTSIPSNAKSISSTRIQKAFRTVGVDYTWTTVVNNTRDKLGKAVNDLPKCSIYMINGKTRMVYYWRRENALKEKTIIKYLGDNPIGKQWNVIFTNDNGTQLMQSQKVLDGCDAIEPNPYPSKTGYVFYGWKPLCTNVHSDLTCVATYKKNAEDHYVTFVDYDCTELKKTQVVQDGEDAIPPDIPFRSGFSFVGWNPSNLNVHSNLTCKAQYVDGNVVSKNAITDRMFYSNRSLQLIEIPNEITSIGNSSFSQCNMLNSVKFDDIKSLGQCAFYNTQVSEMTMNNTLISLAKYALSGTAKLVDMTMKQRDFNKFDDNALSGSSITSISFTDVDSIEVL